MTLLNILRKKNNCIIVVKEIHPFICLLTNALKIMMLNETLCTFSLGALVSVASAQTHQFSIVDNVRLNWTQAQAHCRQFFTDLVTIESSGDTRLILSLPTFKGRLFVCLSEIYTTTLPVQYLNRVVFIYFR